MAALCDRQQARVVESAESSFLQRESTPGWCRRAREEAEDSGAGGAGGAPSAAHGSGNFVTLVNFVVGSLTLQGSGRDTLVTGCSGHSADWCWTCSSVAEGVGIGRKRYGCQGLSRVSLVV
jgi:hypothetical protein